MDETTKQQDASAKDSSAGKEGSTSARTYTESDVQKAVSDALSKAGRDAKSLEGREQSLKEREEAIRAKEAETETKELEEAKSDPQKLQTYQAKKARKEQQQDIEAQKAQVKKERAELERDKVEHEAELKAARETQREIAIWKIAEKYSVDPVMLKDLNIPLDQTEAVAKRLQKPKEGETKVDSGVTSGGSTTLKGNAALADFFRNKK